ncbi:AAA family ATPase [Celeribacter naphthalenivorans]|uniref:AAA family ATPase n=1 Tax=Celeribacter naphthalenivorans TaxID=1614694 RepID=UPI001CFA3881|nr:AAA family ATPase [Celeribacter naphthalenivorans]
MAEAVRANTNIGRRQAELVSAFEPLDQIKPVLQGRYLVKGVLDRGAFSCMFGPSNVGKSFLALDLAAHVSAGIPWFGHRVSVGAGPAVYISAEGGAVFGNRAAALRLTKPDVAAQAEAAGMGVLRSSIDLCGPDDAAEIIQLIKEQMAMPPSLVIVDTLARSMGQGNENDGRDMGAVAANCGRIQTATEAHVMLVHHTGKDAAKGARGHYSFHASLDSEIELKVEDKNMKRASAEFTKQRDNGYAAPLHFTLKAIEIGTDEDGEPVTSAVIEEATEAPKNSRGALAGNEKKQAEAKGRAIAACRLLPSDPFTVEDARRILVEAGIVKRSTAKNAVKSERTTTTRILENLEAEGLVTRSEDGKFSTIRDGGDHAE